jgi:hypothetical protein
MRLQEMAVKQACHYRGHVVLLVHQTLDYRLPLTTVLWELVTQQQNNQAIHHWSLRNLDVMEAPVPALDLASHNDIYLEQK